MLFAIKDWSVCAFLNQTVNVEFLFFSSRSAKLGLHQTVLRLRVQ